MLMGLVALALWSRSRVGRRRRWSRIEWMLLHERNALLNQVLDVAHVAVLLRREERQGRAFKARTTGTADAVDIRFR